MIEQILQDSSLEFNELEKKVHEFVCGIGCMLLKAALEKRDEEIARTRDKKKYRHKGYRKDCIKTMMGEVEYSKAIYKVIDDGSPKYMYLLNENIKISKIGKISANLTEKIISSVCTNSYRTSAKTISENTNQAISHEGVRKVILKVGKEIHEKEQEKVVLLKKQKLEAGTEKSLAIFEEADGLWISLQGKDKVKAIEYRKSKAEREGKEYKEPRSIKSELKLYVSYKGWKKDDRHSLVGKQYTTGFVKAKELSEIRKAKLYEKYDLSEVKAMILNGDGAGWIKRLTLRNQVYQKDSFHIRQSINRNIEDPSDRNGLNNLIREKRYSEIYNFIEALKYKSGGEESQINKLMRLQEYLKDGLPRYTEIIKDMPEAPAGMEYRGMGTCESEVFCVLSRRFSDRRMSFSKFGATMLSKVVALKAENQGKDILKVVETPVKIDDSIERWITDIEEKANRTSSEKKVKLKPSLPIKTLKKPYEGAALTAGSKVIRRLTGLKPLSELA